MGAWRGFVLNITLIGLGPWGLTMLERLVTTLREQPDTRPVHIDVIEPSSPGSGVFALDTPDWLILNTPCGQHSLYPLHSGDGPLPRYGVGFFEWAQRKGYRWVGHECVITRAGRPLSPHDFLPRRVMGEYLNWFYGALVAELPSGVDLTHHSSPAVAVEPAADGARHPERVLLADGTVLAADRVVLASGHTPNQTGDGPGAMVPAFPLTGLDGVTQIGITGMGLVATDVVTGLTLGRGGRFIPTGGQRLRYLPSGYEPRIQLLSRSGLPYCAKSAAVADPTGAYIPAIATSERIKALRGPDGTRQVDVRAELLPLVCAEMTARFHTQSARLHGDRLIADRLHQQLGDAWRQSPQHFRELTASYEPRHGAFDAEGHLFAGGGNFDSAQDYQDHVAQTVAEDLDSALVEGGASPQKAAYEVLRVLRDDMRGIIEYKGPTLESYLDFQVNIRNRIHRLVAGPPALRSQQLLALLEADIVSIPYGPYPTISIADGVIASTQLKEPHQERVQQVVQGYLEEPAVHRSSSPLLRQLSDTGRLRQLHYGDTPVGSLDLTPGQQPVGSDGKVQERMWVFGTLTEGVRYFTHYIPSPKSRVRAFQDAQEAVDGMLV